MPDSFDKFPNIYRLDLISSGFVSFERVPHSISKLANLEELYMKFVQINKLPETLKKLKKLKRLTVKHAGLEIFPDLVFSLDNLRTLDLTNNFNLDIPRAQLSKKKLFH